MLPQAPQSIVLVRPEDMTVMRLIGITPASLSTDSKLN